MSQIDKILATARQLRQSPYGRSPALASLVKALDRAALAKAKGEA